MRPQRPSDPEVRRIAIGDGSCAYVDEGQGPVVLALHGLPGTHRDFRWLAAALAGRVRLLRVDLPGFGETRGPAPRTWVEIAAWVRRFAAAVIDGPCVVLGHSFGAPLATMVAADPAVGACGLAWLAPVGVRPHRLVRRLPPLRLVARLARVPGLRPGVLHGWRGMMRMGGFPASVTIPDVARTLEILGAFRFEAHAAAVGALRVPVLAAWTQDDALVEPEVVRELCAAAPDGPRVGFATGGHNLQKTRAVEVAEALVGFVRGCAEQAGGASASGRSGRERT